jgi:hypothetical protein
MFALRTAIADSRVAIQNIIRSGKEKGQRKERRRVKKNKSCCENAVRTLRKEDTKYRCAFSASQFLVQVASFVGLS